MNGWRANEWLAEKVGASTVPYGGSKWNSGYGTPSAQESTRRIPVSTMIRYLIPKIVGEQAGGRSQNPRKTMGSGPMPQFNLSYITQLLARLGLLVLTAGAVMTTGCDRGGIPVARYTDFDYFWYPDTRRLAGFGSADLYMQTTDGQTFYLPQLTPDDVGKTIGWEEVQLIKPHMIRYENGMSRFRFENGTLDSFDFYTSSDPGRTMFLLSRKAEGPFMPMPKTKEELVALFGEPVEWDRYHPPSSP
jgi:hypothetical protein